MGHAGLGVVLSTQASCGRNWHLDHWVCPPVQRLNPRRWVTTSTSVRSKRQQLFEMNEMMHSLFSPGPLPFTCIDESVVWPLYFVIVVLATELPVLILSPFRDLDLLRARKVLLQHTY